MANPETRDSVLRVVMKQSLKRALNGSLSRGGLRMFVYESPLRLSVTVEDQCGRGVMVVHEVVTAAK